MRNEYAYKCKLYAPMSDIKRLLKFKVTAAIERILRRNIRFLSIANSCAR